jgi:hypothetical protein
MSENIEVRKIPKKSIIIIVIMTAIILAGFVFITITKNMKMEEVLLNLGFKKISHLKVVDKISVEDRVTKIKSTVYKVAFIDNIEKKECAGFIHRSNDGKYSKDIDCK